MSDDWDGGDIFLAVVFGLLGIVYVGVPAAIFTLLLHFGHKMTFPEDAPRIGYQPGSDHRGTINIVWSCLSTIFICLYASVHTSVPKSDAARWKKMVAKIGLVGAGLLAPEAIVMLSAAEFFEAVRGTKDLRRALRKNPPTKTDVEKAGRPKGKSFDDDKDDDDDDDYEDEKVKESLLLVRTDSQGSIASQHQYKNAQQWTIQHTFFATMHGFQDYNGKKVKLEHLLTLANNNTMPETWDKLDLYRREIKDKSKADPLVKLITCIQIVWFLVNIVARLIRHLPVSPLELTTCGYIVCALIVYMLWWNKPYNVSERITLPIDISKTEETSVSDYSTGKLFTVTGFGALLFGACHLIAWNEQFINSTGTWMWRITSILITALPFASTAVGIFYSNMNTPDWLDGVTAFILVSAYFWARMILLMLLVLSFWSLPAGVYEVTDWSHMLPTFG